MRRAENRAAAGKEKNRVEFPLWPEWGQVFCVFKMMQSCLIIDAASVDVKKNQGLTFHWTADKPKDVLPDRGQGHQTWNIRLILPEDGASTPSNFPQTSGNKNQGCLRQRTDPLPLFCLCLCLPPALPAASTTTTSSPQHLTLAGTKGSCLIAVIDQFLILLSVLFPLLCSWLGLRGVQWQSEE